LQFVDQALEHSGIIRLTGLLCFGGIASGRSQRHQGLEETLMKLRRYTITFSQPNPSTELLERDALKKP
jgi:hypothetical protein